MFQNNHITSSSSVENLIVLGATQKIEIKDSIIDLSENEGPSFIKIVDSYNVEIDGLDVNHLTGSTSFGKSVIYIDIKENADFTLRNCYFHTNYLKKTIMFNI